MSTKYGSATPRTQEEVPLSQAGIYYIYIVYTRTHERPIPDNYIEKTQYEYTRISYVSKAPHARQAAKGISSSNKKNGSQQQDKSSRRWRVRGPLTTIIYQYKTRIENIPSQPNARCLKPSSSQSLHRSSPMLRCAAQGIILSRPHVEHPWSPISYDMSPRPYGSRGCHFPHGP